mgnify:CR=1 FL=1
MTRNEFQKLVNEIVLGSSTKATVNQLEITWMTGGAWGGNCWDDSDPGSYCPDPEPEPEFTDLDQILEKIAPNLTFLQYKRLMSKVQYDTSTNHEYYGNHTTYASRSIQIDDIWDFLEEWKLV